MTESDEPKANPVSDVPAAGSDEATTKPTGVIHESGRSRAKARLVVGLIMLVFSIIGIAVTDYYGDYAWKYWASMVPIFGVLCVVLAWIIHPEQDRPTWAKIGNQVLHWLGLLVALYLINEFETIGSLSAENAGQVMVLMLALTTFLAGVHFDWTFMIIGAVLGAFSLGITFVEEYIFVAMLPVGLIAAAVLFIWRKRFAHKAEAKQLEAE